MVIAYFGYRKVILATTVTGLFHPAIVAGVFAVGGNTQFNRLQLPHAVMPLQNHPCGGCQVAKDDRKKQKLAHNTKIGSKPHLRNDN